MVSPLGIKTSDRNGKEAAMQIQNDRKAPLIHREYILKVSAGFSTLAPQAPKSTIGMKTAKPNPFFTKKSPTNAPSLPR